MPFEKRTRGSLLHEYFRDKAYEYFELDEQRQDEGYWEGLSLDERTKIEQRLRALASILFDKPMDDTLRDPLVEKWERELAMGLEPDLNEEINGQ